MPTALIDYRLDSTTVSNPDGTSALSVSDATVVPGPGVTVAGTFPDALDFGTLGRGAVDVSDLALDRRQFAIRVVFQANGPIATRANLVESNRLPFALFLIPRGNATFDLVASVQTVAHGWRAASTRFAAALQPGVWYTADLVYDLDTVALFVDEKIVSVHAFWWGAMAEPPGTEMFVATWVDGARDHFNGKIAAITWSAGIPQPLHIQLDERRSHPEWFITHKLETLRSRLDLGEPLAGISFSWTIGAYVQRYEHGALMYHDSVGTAFEMHGAIWAHYQALTKPAALGYLVSDEVRSTNETGRKSVFSKGAIYWSDAAGAVPVLGQIYIDYEGLGEARAIGFPLQPVQSIPGGFEQVFQGARMYHKRGQPNAHEVHGAILAKYQATGGLSAWGFPISHETDVRRGSTRLGKYSEFERCTIYWSSATGAHEVHGDIRTRYRDLGGPPGDLGFPTSDEMDVPGAPGARFNTFQNGSLLWYGSLDSIILARPFRIRIGRIDSKESEGFLMGQNDLYIYIKVTDGGQVVYDQRRPSSGDWGGDNIVNVNFTIPVVITPNVAKTVTFTIDVWEADPGADDHIGTWTKVLDAANAWGLAEAGGILNSGSFSRINSITAAVEPVVNPATLSDIQKFWGIGNQGTDDISYNNYAAAFSNVDSDTEWWDATDWLDKAFFELVVQDLAEKGNCFGMSLEAIYSRKGDSLFSLPIDRFKTWSTVEREFNIKHCYQVGAGAIWWFVGEFLTGNTHDPVDVFNRTREEFNRGNHPVICIAQNYDFSGKPHCVLPIGWDSSSKPWRMRISDPNAPQAIRTLTVNPDSNEFEYIGSDTYRGGEWTGGRFHYMPFSLVSTRPRTPIWDAILLILAGTIIILGDDAQTTSLTDGAGNDLDAHGNRARQQLRQGVTLADYFVGFKGYDQARAKPSATARAARRAVRGVRPRGKGTVAGEVLLRRALEGAELEVGRGAIDASVLAHMPVGALVDARGFRTLRSAVLEGQKRAKAGALAERTLYRLAADPKVLRGLDAAARKLVRDAAGEALPGDFRHSIVGLRRGDFRYALKHGLTELRLASTSVIGEQTKLAVDRLGSSANTIGIRNSRDKTLQLELANKLGVGGDHVRVIVDRLPLASAAELQMNLKPGFGGFELKTNGERVNARVEVRAFIDRKAIRRTFTVPVEGGARFTLSSVLSQNRLGVARIDNLFGPSLDTKILSSGS